VLRIGPGDPAAAIDAEDGVRIDGATPGHVGVGDHAAG
jgi:hypothetical protein